MTNFEEFIKEIATDRQYEAWKLRRTKMRRADIAAKMGVSPAGVSNLRRRLLKKIKKKWG